MIISADELPDAANLSAHLAVVGAGPVGIVIALEAAQRGLEVLLIESGYEKFNSRAQQLSDAAEWDPGLHTAMSVAVRRQLGGTSVIWGGRCVPFDSLDFDHRPYVSDIAWPVSHAELAPYVQRACDWLQCGRPVFDVTQMPHLPSSIVPGLANGDASTATLERWTLSTDFAREHSGALKRSARIRLCTGLTCIGVRSLPGGTRASQLSCRTLPGKRVSVLARSYVIACGGLETTRLLLASRGPQGLPLGNHSGHLGSWYMAHVDGVIAKARFSTPPRDTISGYERDIDGTYVRRRFSIKRDVQLQRELPNSIAFLANPELADYRHRNGVLSLAYLALRSPLGRGLAPAEHRLPVTGDSSPSSAAGNVAVPRVSEHLANVARDWSSVARFAAEFGMRRFLARGRRTPGLFTAYSQENLYPLQYHGEQIPNRHSRVSLTDARDSVGMPKLNIDLRFSKQDADGVLRCHEVWDEYLRRSGCGHLEYVSPDPASLVRSQLGGGTHQLGTTRMAARAEDGVVDKDLAVHGMSNVFIASSSVFLTSSQANPTFMALVLALRLVDHLESRLPEL